MAEMQALILAAGRGSRLGNSGHNTPKCLLEIGRRRLIEHQLDTLAETGIGPTSLTVGYGADEIRELVGMRAEYIQNTRWATTNSLYSFSLARDWVEGDVMVLNCDVLFCRQVIERLLDTPGDALAIDRSSGAGREQMKVRVADGHLAAMSKGMLPAEAAGENVGILKLTAETARRLFQHAEDLIRQGHEKDWLGAAVNRLCLETPIKAVDISRLPWIEIDFPVDLDRARREVWPAIKKADGRWFTTWQRLRWAALAALFVLALAMSPLLSTLTPQPEPLEWDSLPIDSLATARIQLGDRDQGWWLLPAGVTGTIQVGPGPLRVETRLLDHPGDQVEYVLETTLGDLPASYHQLTTRLSGKARHEDWLISHKERLSLEAPDEKRTLKVRILAPSRADCLIRVRQPESTTDD